GYIWNLAMLNKIEGPSIDSQPHRIVDFHVVYSLPVAFLQSMVSEGICERIRLLPPYREHISQAFARFFMRVGLPQNVQKAW
ncbi:MAG: hypothetical protein KC931_27990, partial [Candidatus Omnitrophica bacterium]|nr:hypothetical protein [Candidatus Omnitrophota bacterium]